jgi:hypothetical protein
MHARTSGVSGILILCSVSAGLVPIADGVRDLRTIEHGQHLQLLDRELSATYDDRMLLVDRFPRWLREQLLAVVQQEV